MLQTNRALAKEQTELYAVEKKLVKVLPVIQEALNSLKVEELHLKSLSLQHSLQCKHETNSPFPTNNSLDITLYDPLKAKVNPLRKQDDINRQEIDLEMFVDRLQNYDVEQDSD
ncbi:uncharacterized protein Dwil_GK11852 [Drosophila willistoni]|uniref:Uncharacterized protein n=1 Tax=Drosophila willistoni TaxID=7260 RepID=B4NB93_DROWI|nr:uncharacterized protein LOC6647186 [Drosophila willistoni]EDW81057.1 uncharacterized protein Dwil_GK11852 [Drosophila willistoni]